MVQIVLGGGSFTKGELVDMAYEQCSLSGAEFERTPDEMMTGLRLLNALMAETAADFVDLGYEQPTYGQGKLEELSGIPNDAVHGVIAKLAIRIAPPIAATLSPEAKEGLASWSRLIARNATVPVTLIPSHTPRGAGGRRRFAFISEGPGIVPLDDDPGDLAGVIA